ncbi:MAG TPA: hypothetical protein VLA09_07685 [Longimicrobiales bacterium]|nr:hypothetical protein [Longimicrobiales bacterium]
MRDDVLPDERRARRLRLTARVALAIGLVTAALYVAPGSPVPAWLGGALRALGSESREAASEAASQGRGEGGGSTGPTGVVLAPGPSLSIDFTGPETAGYAHVEVMGVPEVVVRAPTGSTRFVAEPERIRVHHSSSDTVLILLPRAAPRVTIRSGGRELLRKEGAVVSATVGRRTDGSHVLPLAPGG